jgi:phytoene synthase
VTTDLQPDRSAGPSPPGLRSSGPAIDAAGLADGRAIQRETGKTFHLATRLFPEEIRDATYVLYGFVRIADEIVDGEAERSPAEQAAAIEELREIVLEDAPADEPVLEAFQTVRDAYGIRQEDLEAFLDAMAADVDGEGTRYATPEAVDDYIHGSAAAVGLMMTAVMGVDEPAARPHAASLGAAFQLTNFLRDVREDVVAVGVVDEDADGLHAEPRPCQLCEPEVPAVVAGGDDDRRVRMEVGRRQRVDRAGVATNGRHAVSLVSIVDEADRVARVVESAGHHRTDGAAAEDVVLLGGGRRGVSAGLIPCHHRGWCPRRG